MTELETRLRTQSAALAAVGSETTVEYESCSNIEGRTIIRIHGPDRESVQHQIEKVMGAVERSTGGFANFIGPRRTDDGYRAIGEVLVNV